MRVLKDALGVIQVVWFDLDDEGWADDELEPWLQESERERCRRLVFSIHQRRQRVACALLRRLISQYLERPPATLTWSRAPHGKPFLADHGCSFNLTHSGPYAALALAAAGEMGLDIEERQRSVDFFALGKRFFAEPEAQMLERASDPRLLFFEIWTAKEAYIKALGDGLTHPLDRFLTVHREGWGLFDVEGQPLPWELRRPACPWPGISAALVCPAGPAGVEAYLYAPGGHWQACP